MRDTYAVKKKTISSVVQIVKYLFLIGMCYLYLFPLIYLVVSAVQDPQTANDPSIMWVPKDLSLSNFKNALEYLHYGKSFLLTVLIAVFGTLAMLLSCAMVGYGFARYNFWEKKIAFLLVIVLIIIPPQTTTISTFLNYRFFDFGGLMKLLAPITGVESISLVGSPATMILPALFASGIRAGLSIFIFRQFFLGQPKELEEAAKIDGCGAFGTYFKIMLPLAVPAIITVAVFSFVWYWNDSFFSSLFFGDKIKPLSAELSVLRTSFLEATYGALPAWEQKGILSAGALLCVVPPMIIYLFIQRYFTESIERTGIVG